MNAKNIVTRLMALLLSVPVVSSPPAVAEEYPVYEVSGPESSTLPEIVFSQAELDQMLAPIALYPDSLLSQILMASTYPLEVVEAARWSRANPGLSGEAAVRVVQDRNWDPSVKSLVAFPQILGMMDEKLDWTQRLGDAFLVQQGQVMDTVQDLRQRAYAAGNLQSTEHYRVVRQAQTIIVESPSPQVIYVPYYDPFVVYGAWRWPAYRPVYWAPWHGYSVRVGYSSGFRWSVGITIGSGFFFGACDWSHRYVRVASVRPFYYHYVDARPTTVVNVWQHVSTHRRGVPYRHPAVHAKFHVVGSPPLRHESRVRSAPSYRSERASRPDDRHERWDEQRKGSPHNGNEERVHGQAARSANVAPRTHFPETRIRTEQHQEPRHVQSVPARGPEMSNRADRRRGNSDEHRKVSARVNTPSVKVVPNTPPRAHFPETRIRTEQKIEQRSEPQRRTQPQVVRPHTSLPAAIPPSAPAVMAPRSPAQRPHMADRGQNVRQGHGQSPRSHGGGRDRGEMQRGNGG